jgi:outer membrane protein TolC
MSRRKAMTRSRKAKLAAGLCAAGLSLLAVGCNELVPVAGFQPPPPAVVRGAAPEVTHLPPVAPNAAGVADKAAVKSLPISLDTVLRLAEEQNAQVGQARAKVDEAIAEEAVAAKRWLPDLFVGAAWYRHEGGIQTEEGPLVHSSTGAMFAGLELDGRFDIREIAFAQVNAQRRTWQNRGELSRVSSETLLEAANTYIDLLAARAAEAVGREIEKSLTNLLDYGQRLASTEPGARVEVYRIQAGIHSVHQSILRAQAQAQGASAKLAYLLDLGPCIELIPVDPTLVPFDLVDPSPSWCDLVDRALANGPGIREMQGLLSLIQESIDRAQGPGRLLPTFEVRMAEGGFGAGAGDRMDWDNRWDLCVQARWNLTALASAKARRQAAQAKVEQVQFAYEDLRGKLAAGVQEARETILSGHAMMREDIRQMEQSTEAHRLADLRLRERQPGAAPSEVLRSIEGLADAKRSYINVIREYDKAQIRLMILLGPDGANGCGAHGHLTPAAEQLPAPTGTPAPAPATKPEQPEPRQSPTTQVLPPPPPKQPAASAASRPAQTAVLPPVPAAYFKSSTPPPWTR